MMLSIDWYYCQLIDRYEVPFLKQIDNIFDYFNDKTTIRTASNEEIPMEV
jgi:hypothetical protein